MPRTPRQIAWDRTVFVMNTIRENVDSDEAINRTRVAKASGIAASTFYRWLESPPDKIDAAAIAAVADYLHEHHGYEDFVTRWRRAARTIKE